MTLVNTGFDGLLLIEPVVHSDPRGYFYESYNQKTFEKMGIKNTFVQDNESFSKYGTLRGLHFQKGDSAQAKLVRAIQGEILDVAVDLRENSKTFGKHFSVHLSGENKRMLIIPRGFAHGFVVLSETAIFSYKCDNYYSPTDEAGINWNDPDLNIDWKVDHKNLLLSNKDINYPFMKTIFRD